MSAREFRDRLRRRAKRASLEISPELGDGLERYFALLTKWNAKINLTSFKLEPSGDDEAIDRLLVEPLVAARHVTAMAQSAIDIGSGGGSPALPLAWRVHACPSGWWSRRHVRRYSCERPYASLGSRESRSKRRASRNC
jgi:16S rRNA G527 N7-methylase RsmG